MKRLTQHLDFSPDTASLPSGFSDEIYELSRTVASAETARQVFDKLRPLLKTYRADRNLAISCGLLLEKQRSGENMSSVWSDLQARYPDDETALRMLMRWYRRDGRTDEGIALIADRYPGRRHSIRQAKHAILGLSELKAWDEIDAIMDMILVLHAHDRSIRMAYIKALADQLRFPEAARLAANVENRDRMGTASQTLLTMVERKAGLMAAFRRDRATDVIDDILVLAKPPRPFSSARRLVFFSGQLGTGGAERQMTRLACAYRDRAGSGEAHPDPEVWVKHADPATGGDFYRPLLKSAGVMTRVMTEEPEPDIAALPGVSDTIKELLGLLPHDMQRHTAQLIPLFRANKTDVAYLWQDGGIVQSALAAVIAGVPRIVTSFRGLPPNLRPHFFRPELPVLYTALARMPHVSLTANSRKTAAAYEDWLSLPSGSVGVIPNAVPPVVPDGDASDAAFWSDLMEVSATCTKTVLGVFRFDHNKRPLQWIEAAARYLDTHDDTRFVMLGHGQLFERCEALIEERGLSHRIFLAGIRSNVGFYMHRADLVMHLAQMEGLPNVLIESQLAGTPVLATPAGGSDEVVQDGVTGVLLSTAHILQDDELDRMLAGLLSDPDALARMGIAATAFSGNRFSADTILQRTTDLFLSPGQGRQ